jgi:glucoamylase
VFKRLIELSAQTHDPTLQSQIDNYVGAQAKLQTVPNLSGDIGRGAGLGEPKFNVDMTVFADPWGMLSLDRQGMFWSQWLLMDGE